MRVLLLGGTRFTGRALASALSLAGHEVTVASRRAAPAGSSIIGIQGERPQLLSALHGRSFDVVLDFIAYDGQDARDALAAVRTPAYILVSTTWLPRYLGLPDGAAPAVGEVDGDPWVLPQITRRYLSQKTDAESAIVRARTDDGHATILRLPVMTGPGDHTKRLHFYRSRFRDGRGVLNVDGGDHGIQMATSDDLARCIHAWLETHDPGSQPIWEALNPAPVTWGGFLKELARGEGATPDLVSISRMRLRSELPDLLEADPLWRERAIAVSETNLFHLTGVEPTPVSLWAPHQEELDPSALDPELREREVQLIEGLVDGA